MEMQITTQGGFPCANTSISIRALKEAGYRGPCGPYIAPRDTVLDGRRWTRPSRGPISRDSDTGSYVNQAVYGGAEFYRADLDEVSSASSLFGLSNFAEPRAGWVYVAHDLDDMALFIQKRDRIWRDVPNQLEVVRFSLDEVAENAAELSFSDGDAVSWTQDGNYYLMRPSQTACTWPFVLGRGLGGVHLDSAARQ